MKYIKPIKEAVKTKCQTPGVIFKTHIKEDKVDINLELPSSLELSKEEAELLEKNIHNALELVFAPYFK